MFAHLVRTLRPRPRLVASALVGLVVVVALPQVLPTRDVTRWLIGWNAGAIIFHFNRDIISRRQCGLAEERTFSRGHIARAHMNFATISHCIACIDDKIDDDLFKLIEISFDEPQIAAVFDIKLDFFAHQSAQEHLQISQHTGETVLPVADLRLLAQGGHDILEVKARRCELLGEGQQRSSVPILGYLFFVGDRTRTNLPYVNPEDETGSDPWLSQRHQTAMTPEGIVAQAEAAYSTAFADAQCLKMVLDWSTQSWT